MFTKKFVGTLTVVGLLLALFPALLFGQASADTATLNGTVLDPSGASVPEATVTARNLATGLSRTTTTETPGFFTLPNLPVGRYEVTVERSGFSALRRTVELSVGQVLTLELSLRVGAAAETITVTEETPLVETARTKISAAVNADQVDQLPLNGRNFIGLVMLTPGVARDTRGGDVSFAGQKGTFNSFQIDGADNNNTFFGQTLGRSGVRNPYQFSQDAIQEFQVNTGTYSAEFGRAAGAVINVITKSGTNEFHGGIFAFHRNDALSANSFLNNARRVAKPSSKNWQFGGNFGGPIVKNRGFFFFDFDGQRNPQPQTVFSPVPLSSLSPAALAVINGPLAGAFQTYSKRFDNDVYLIKSDWQLGANHRLSGRYNHQNFTGVNLENAGNQSAREHTGNSIVRTDTVTIALSSLASSRLVNEARFQWARDNEPGTANSDAPEAVIQERGTTIINTGRNNFSPRQTLSKRWQWNDTLTYTRGRHTMKAGFDFNHDKHKNFFPGLFGGQYTFSNLTDFPNSPSRYQQSFAGPGTTGPLTLPNSTDYAWFLQDDFRVTPRVTLNFGLRYDIQILEHPPVKNPDPQLAAARIDTSTLNTDSNNFGPRLGLAWSMLKSNRLVLRAGYGIYYARTPAIMLAQAHSTNGINVLGLTFTGAAIPRYPNVFTTPPTGGVAGRPSIYVFEPNYVEPYTQQGSLGLEYQVVSDLAVSASYLTVKGTHLSRTRDSNLLPPVPTNITMPDGTVSTFARFPGRLFSNFDRISYFESSANSIYHGLLVQARKRMSRHYSFTVAYTLSKVIDDVPDQTSVLVGNSGDDAKIVQNTLNFRDDRAPGGSDQQHLFALSSIWDLDYANKHANPGVRWILGFWQVGGIFTAASPKPYTGKLGTDLNNDGNRFTDRVPGLGRNTFRKYNLAQADLRVQRDFPIKERARVSFIMEAFNLTNRANFNGVNDTMMSVVGSAADIAAGRARLAPVSTFGTPRVTVEQDVLGQPFGRMFQLALKVTF